MAKVIPNHRVESLVIAGTDPRRHVMEFLNNLTEDEEHAVLDFLAEHLPLLRVCREIEEERADDDL